MGGGRKGSRAGSGREREGGRPEKVTGRPIARQPPNASLLPVPGLPEALGAGITPRPALATPHAALRVRFREQVGGAACK